MSIGYFADIADADAYFTAERLETDAWDDLVTGSTLQQKAVVNAFNRIFYDPRWDLPTYANATVLELIKLRMANAEMAIYLAVHLADEDIRKGIQAQGVTDAGIVKESYLDTMLNDLPVPPFVIALLADWATDERFAVVEVRRDEDEERMKF